MNNNDRSQPARRETLRAVPSAPHPAALSASSVANDIELLAHADHTLAAELDLIAASRTPVCAATVGRLEDLLEIVRDGARVRSQLQTLDPELLRTGGQLWLARRQQAQPGDPNGRSGHAAH